VGTIGKLRQSGKLCQPAGVTDNSGGREASTCGKGKVVDCLGVTTRLGTTAAVAEAVTAAVAEAVAATVTPAGTLTCAAGVSEDSGSPDVGIGSTGRLLQPAKRPGKVRAANNKVRRLSNLFTAKD
jgi:hypothetical protein